MHISPATLSDAYYLRTRLRVSDRREIHATGRSVKAVVPASYECSTKVYTVRAEEGGKPIAIYGVAPTPGQPEVGTVWMLSTHSIRLVSKSFFKQVPKILEEFQEIYPAGLHNLALLRDNKVTLEWLHRLGFSFGPIVEQNGNPFIYFHYRKP